MAPKRAAKRAAKAKARPVESSARSGAENLTTIAKLEFEQAEKAKKPTRARARSVEEIVNKQLRDHFAGWDSHQTDSLLNGQGKSLREVLTNDRQKIDDGAADSPTLGKKYYEHLHNEFSASASPFKTLKVLNPRIKY